MARRPLRFCASFVVMVSGSAGAAEPSAVDSAGQKPGSVLYTTGRTWVWSRPSADAKRLGYVRGGQPLSVVGEVVRGSGCEGAWAPVAPRGFVCDEDATRDPRDRSHRVARLLSPQPQAHLFSYVISNGTPMYRRLPSPKEWAHAERDLGRAGEFERYPWNEKHERLAEERIPERLGEVPFFLEGGGSARAPNESQLVRMFAPLGTMLATVRAFRHEGRVWLLTTDGTVVPADRVRPYRRSSFHGVVLGEGVELPMAWTSPGGAPTFRRGEDGSWTSAGDLLGHVRVKPATDAASLPGPEGKRLVRLSDDEGSESARFVDVRELHVAEHRKRPAAVASGERWIHVSLKEGTLVAYQGDAPAFATLISPGAGGVGRSGADPVKASTTPRGLYRIQYKYRSQTMSPQKDRPETQRTFWIAGVPFAQYFRIPFALHAAYWHEDFGLPMSGGCVNLSPADALFMFHFTRPALPPGWEAIWAGGEAGLGTRVLVTR